MCHAGSLREGATTVTMERGEATIVFKHVPAEVCEICGEAFVGEEISEDVYEQAESAVEAGVQFDVRQWTGREKATA
jgi:YgiT-type zinc finger domain-containing protein